MNDATAAERRHEALPRLMRAMWGPKTWKALAHLVTGSFIGFIAGISIFVLGITAVAGIFTVLITLVACGILFALSSALTVLQRSRHTAFLDVQWPPAAPAQPLTFMPRALLAVLPNSRTWRHLLYHVISSTYGLAAGLVAVAMWGYSLVLIPAPFYITSPDPVWNPMILSAIGLAMLVAAPWGTRGLAVIDAQMAQYLLGTSRSEELELRVTDLAASRDSTVDAADAERKRIERDLHDGAQQRLTSLAMNLGIARATIDEQPDRGARAIEQAHEEAKQVLVELRDLVRGLHPAVLEDRGLDAALSAVVARAPLPVRLNVDMERRVARDVEAVAYFVVSEALNNVARHSGAANAEVEVSLHDDSLNLRVTDDGTGGADPGGGTGLRGLADRVRSVDGSFRLTSPSGGPTTIEAELPCAS